MNAHASVDGEGELAAASPLVTFYLFAYNQSDYIREAVNAAFAQTYGRLEIILSDDCSSDDTFEIMQSMAQQYEGNHRIRLNRNTTNLGLIEHVNAAFEMASGELIVAAAGDDISSPYRVARMVEAYLANGKRAMLIHSSVTEIGPDGERLGLTRPPIERFNFDYRQIAVSSGLYIGATAAWNPSLYRIFGGIEVKGTYEDLVLGFRAMLLESLIYIDEPLVLYRKNVGISAARQIKRFDVRSFTRQRTAGFTLLFATLEQRRRDLQTYAERPECSHMQRAAVDKLMEIVDEAKIRVGLEANFWKTPLSLLAVLKKRPVLALRVTASEAINLFWFLRKSLLSNSRQT